MFLARRLRHPLRNGDTLSSWVNQLQNPCHVVQNSLISSELAIQKRLTMVRATTVSVCQCCLVLGYIWRIPDSRSKQWARRAHQSRLISGYSIGADRFRMLSGLLHNSLEGSRHCKARCGLQTRLGKPRRSLWCAALSGRFHNSLWGSRPCIHLTAGRKTRLGNSLHHCGAQRIHTLTIEPFFSVRTDSQLSPIPATRATEA